MSSNPRVTSPDLRVMSINLRVTSSSKIQVKNLTKRNAKSELKLCLSFGIKNDFEISRLILKV